MKARTLVLACALDLVAGDPAWFPHPVRAFGWAAARGERLALRLAGGDAAREVAFGAALTLAIVGGAYAAPALALAAVRRRSTTLAEGLEVALAWTTLAMRDLFAEARAVEVPLFAGDLAAARRRVARIVGRDTQGLDASGVARATIETLAESTGDGIAGPLLALAAGGVPLAFAFKAASTLDSTIGYHEAPHTFTGRIAARLDDVLCYAPARASALAIALAAPVAGGSTPRALATWARDGHLHASPNAGRPEAAMAGALGVRLGGASTYAGVAHAAPHLGAEFAAPESPDARRGRLVAIAAAALLVQVALVLARAAER